jgi:hypothetical protein
MADIEVSIHTRWYADGTGINETGSIRPDTPELRATLEAIRCYPLDRLADAALSRHGYGNSDGGFGVSYERDLTESGECGPIPPECVEVYTFWGPPEGESYVIPERTYLQILALVLCAKGRDQDFRKVAAFLKTLASAEPGTVADRPRD